MKLMCLKIRREKQQRALTAEYLASFIVEQYLEPCKNEYFDIRILYVIYRQDFRISRCKREWKRVQFLGFYRFIWLLHKQGFPIKITRKRIYISAQLIDFNMSYDILRESAPTPDYFQRYLHEPIQSLPVIDDNNL